MQRYVKKFILYKFFMNNIYFVMDDPSHTAFVFGRSSAIL